MSFPDTNSASGVADWKSPALLVRTISIGSPSALLAGILLLASLFQWLSTAPVPAQGALGMGSPLHLSWEASQTGALPGVSSGWRGEAGLHSVGSSLPWRHTSANSSVSAGLPIENGQSLFLVLNRLLL